MSREERLLQLLEEKDRAFNEEKRLRQEAETREQELRKRTEPTTLPDFIDACHVHLSVGFSSRINHKTGTRGKPENAESKLRPNRIRDWTSFPREQSAVWNDLFDVDFVSEGHFTSLNTVKESGEDMRQRSLGSELDLCFYERYAVEDRVSLVIRHLFSDSRLRRVFNLKGAVTFENHGNTISTEERSAGPDLAPDINSPQQSPVQKRRKKVDELGDPLPETPTVRSRSSRPRADQFCVYNTGPDETIPAFIIEYKAPHKLTLGTVEAGLMDMEVDDVVVYNEEDGPIKLARRRVAAVITQTFSYMVQAGLEYGYVCTGETFIFLRIDPDDPTTVYYYLSIPNNDVGETTSWASDSNNNNRLHLTAVGQVLAFTLRALRSPPRSQDWRNKAETRLKRWEIEHDDILFKLDIESSNSVNLSDYKQNRQSRNEYIRESPIKTRSKGQITASTCRTPGERLTNLEPSDDDDDSSGNGGFDPGSPSAGLPRRDRNVMVVVPPPSTQHKKGAQDVGETLQFCTQKCLLGLLNGGLLDGNCPNVAFHGKDRHTIDRHKFRRLARAQILREDSGPFGCESMHRHGTSGALFRLTLFSYGYSLVAKAMPVEMVNRAVYEEHIYRHLRPIQGVYVPVCLGSVDISSRPLWYDGIAEVVHLLFLSHAGRQVKFHAGVNKLKDFVPSASHTLRAIHQLGVLHRDAHGGNMFWNAEHRGVMLIDFERAKILDGQVPVKTDSSKKRKRGTVAHPATGNRHFKIDLFERELLSVASNMT